MSNDETVDHIVGRCLSDFDLLELACDDTDSCIVSVLGTEQQDPTIRARVQETACWLRDGGYSQFRAARPDAGVGSVI